VTYAEEKAELRLRFPYIVNGKFEDGSEVTQERIAAILNDCRMSLVEIAENARKVIA
jgi:hypothetical protein